MGHMTPMEAPEAVTAKLRELTTRYVAAPTAATAATSEKEDVA